MKVYDVNNSRGKNGIIFGEEKSTYGKKSIKNKKAKHSTAKVGTEQKRKKQVPKAPASLQKNKKIRKTRKRKDILEIDNNRDYGDEFFTDELRLKRKKTRLKLEENKVLDIDLGGKPISDRRRKLKKFGLAFFTISMFLVVGVILSLTVFFKSERIEVEGAEHYSAQDIVDASGIALGENLFLCDKCTGEHNIADKLPYIESAKISVKIPSTMLISVTESAPEFICKKGNECILIDSQGKVLEKVTGSVDKYSAPVVSGCGVKDAKPGQKVVFTQSGVFEILKSISQALGENEFSGVKEIDLSNTAEISLNYANRIKIIIGLPEDISYKVKMAKVIITEKLSDTDRGRLDVSACRGKKRASYFKPIAGIYLDKIKPKEQQKHSTEPVTEVGTNALSNDAGVTDKTIVDSTQLYQDATDVCENSADQTVDSPGSNIVDNGAEDGAVGLSNNQGNVTYQ